MEEENVTISDAKNVKIDVKGNIEGFAIREVTGMGWKRNQPPPSIRGLDRSWMGKRVLCILLDKDIPPRTVPPV